MRIFIKTPELWDWKLLFKGTKDVGLCIATELSDNCTIEDVVTMSGDFYVWMKEDLTKQKLISVLNPAESYLGVYAITSITPLLKR